MEVVLAAYLFCRSSLLSQHKTCHSHSQLLCKHRSIKKLLRAAKVFFFFKLTFLLENFITTQWIVLTQVINGYFAIEGEKCGKKTLTFLLTDFLNVFFSYMRDITWLADEDRELFVALSVIIQ